jgi:hypothetical protein
MVKFEEEQALINRLHSRSRKGVRQNGTLSPRNYVNSMVSPK